MNRWKVEEIIEDVCKARGMTRQELMQQSKADEYASARRAIAMICMDKFRMSGLSHNSACTWTEISRMLNIGRTTLHSAARRWKLLEGAQDGQEEERLRDKGCLLPQGEESIHEMAKRLCKRRLSEVPEGRRRELGYWRSQEEVNHG